MDSYNIDMKECENLVSLYKEKLKNKNVFLLCVDSKSSDLFLFLKNNYKKLQLKSITGIHCFYDEDIPNIYYFYDEKGYKEKVIKGTGDLRNEKIIQLIEEAEIIISEVNQYFFSLIIDILLHFQKDFIILCKKYQIKTSIHIKNNKKIKILDIIPLLFKNRCGIINEEKDIRWISNF